MIQQNDGTDEVYERSLRLHRQLRGKIAVCSTVPAVDRDMLSLLYTPGVAAASRSIAADPGQVYELTMKSNTVAIVTDGSSVLGLGNIGPEAALPVMEGKAVLFKECAGINAVPLCLRAESDAALIAAIRSLAPGFGGINLEDIAAPRCFAIEEALQDIGIPVFHDDQHGTAIAVAAALRNAVGLAGKEWGTLRIVINGAGAAGTAIARLLLCEGYSAHGCGRAGEVVMCDSRGIIVESRPDIAAHPMKRRLAAITNRRNQSGGLSDAVANADVFVGVSTGNVVTPEMIRKMSERPIVFALANPVPEIAPGAARQAGAFIVATGRSDFPNQINNAAVFPGIFRGALAARARSITSAMKLAAVQALAAAVPEPTPERLLPDIADKAVTARIAQAVQQAASESVS